MSEPTGPISASEVEPRTEKDEDELRREATRKAVQSRIAHAAALRSAGADVALPSDDLHTRLERSKRKADAASTARFRAQKAVAAKLEEKRS